MVDKLQNICFGSNISVSEAKMFCDLRQKHVFVCEKQTLPTSVSRAAKLGNTGNS